MHREYTKNGYTISTDPGLLDLETIHSFLKNSYWAKNIQVEKVRKSIANSFCFGVYREAKQIGFARVITDFATTGYIADVFILEPYRGQGLSKWLMQGIMEHPDLQ